MSYDKYIKYKNKYLQLKAKYTQVGGAGMWTIEYEEGQDKTTPITQEESDRLNDIIRQNMNANITIEPSTLKNKDNDLLTNEKGDMKYKYIIHADGKTGKRISKSGEYTMKLTESTPPPSASYRYPLQSSASGASAPSPQPQRAYAPSVSYYPPSTPPPASSASYRSPTTSSASYRPPPAPSAPPASSASAKILDLQKKFPNLPAFMSIYESNNPNAPPFIALVVEWNDLSFLGINKEIDRDNVKFKRINDKQVDMTFRGKKYSLINNGEPSIWIHKFK